MAKQSGLHQIKGKVDGYAYYRQSGVKDGLMRRINEGMSSRVKTSEEFANTRLNNSEFGNAADVAKVLASVITPKFRPMFLNFSQAKLTKSLLSLIKQATGDWGQRALSAGDVQAICDAANALAKNDFSSLVESVVAEEGDNAGETTVDFTLTDSNRSFLESIGADTMVINALTFSLNAGMYSVSDKRYIKSSVTSIRRFTLEVDVTDLPTSNSISGAASADPAEGTQQFLITFVIAMPCRVVNNKPYVLQEKCSFIMVPSVVATE